MKVFGLTIGEGGGGPELVVGGIPTVDLLPDEVRVARKSRGIRRGVIAVAVLVIVAVAAGGVAGRLYSASAEAQLAAEQERSAALLARQAEFTEVTTIYAEIEQRTAARLVITGTEIDWRSVIDDISATLPDGAELVSVTIEGSTPMTAHAQATAPLQEPRVATASFTVRSDSLLSVPSMVDELDALTGVVGVAVPSATVTDEMLETSFVMHLGEEAYAQRFAEDDPAGDTEAPADDDEDS